MLLLKKHVEICSFMKIQETINTLTPDDFAIFISFQGHLFNNDSYQLSTLSSIKSPTFLITQMSPEQIPYHFTYVVRCGEYGYYRESIYALTYILNLICF